MSSLSSLCVVEVNGQGFELMGKMLFQPAVTRCVLHDIFDGPILNFTTCDNRSDGCEYDTKNCILAQILGYSLGDFMDITPVIMSPMDPVTPDGKVNFTVSYKASSSIFGIRGFVQLWQFVSVNPTTNVDVYKFTYHQQYINQLPLQTPTYTFNDVSVGKYLLLFWDVGGTRFGLGEPEATVPIVITSVFPKPVAELGLEVSIMLQRQTLFDGAGRCISVNLHTNNMHVQFPYSKYYNVWGGTNPFHYVFFSVQLKGFDGVDLSSYVNNAESVHNRTFFWVWQSDQGNVIDNKHAVIPPTRGKYNCTYCDNPANLNMTRFCDMCANLAGFSSPACASCDLGPNPDFCDFCGGTTGGLCDLESEVQIDSMLRFKVTPLITGSYGVADGNGQVPDPTGDNPNGVFNWRRIREGRKTLFAMRLGYKGMGNSKYGDFWRMRQSYGDATVVAKKIVDMIQVDITPSWSHLKLDNRPLFANATGEMWEYAHVETPQFPGLTEKVPEGEEWFVTYYFAKHVSRPGHMGSNGMVGTYADMYVFRDLFLNVDGIGDRHPDDNTPPYTFCRLDNVGNWADQRCNLISAEMYKFKPFFKEHNNTDDYSCYPVGGDYANDAEFGAQNFLNDCDPAIDYKGDIFTIQCGIPNTVAGSKNADIFTFSDIELGNDAGEDFFDDCESEECEGSYLGPIFYPNGLPPQLVPGVSGCYDGTDLREPTYPTPCSGAVAAFAGGTQRKSCNKCCNTFRRDFGLFQLDRVWNAQSETDGGSLFGSLVNAYVATPVPPYLPFAPSPPTNIPPYDSAASASSTEASRADLACAGYSHGRRSRTAIHIGASSLCDFVRILNMTYNGPWGKGREDPTNNEMYSLADDTFPSFQAVAPYGFIKDCAAGPYPDMYDHLASRRHATRDNQVNFPYYQTNIQYPVATRMFRRNITMPVFLVPGYFAVSNPANDIDQGTPTQPLELQSPPNVLVYPGKGGESTFSVGQDTHMVSIQYEYSNQMVNQEYDPVIWNVQMFASYARFKVYPHITFLHFRNAIKAKGALPARIDITFRVSCPFLGFRNNAKPKFLRTPAYCVEGWFITNQYNEAITMGMKRGPGFAADDDPLSVYAYTSMVPGPGVAKQRQIMAGVEESATITLTIAYKDFDIYHWEFRIRSESEASWGTIEGVCVFDTNTPRSVALGKYRYVPDMVTVTPPPQQYVFRPLQVGLNIAPPVCPYNTPSAIVHPNTNGFFAWDTVYELDLPGVGGIGGTVGDLFLTEFVYYYYKWRFIGQAQDGGDIIKQGFAQQIQTHSPPYEVLICSRDECIPPDEYDILVPPPINANIFERPPSCIDNPTEDTWGCRVNLNDVPDYSGITQEPYCRASSVDGSLISSVLLQPLFIIEPPFGPDNFRSYFFNLTTPYVSPILFSLRNIGVFEQQDQFIVDQFNVPSGYAAVTLFVSFGASQQNLLESPCYEKFVTDVYIPSPFIVSKGSIQKVPGCNRLDNCCYFQPLFVSGSSPYTGLPVTLSGVSAPYIQAGNATDLCFGSPLCLYEVIVNPPLNVDGGICLGQTYTFTVQSPQVLVDSRVGPPVGLSNYTIFNSTNFKYPYRCPTSFTDTLPISGMGPIDVDTVPGPCTNRGTVAQFSFQFTDIACSGPISMLNTDPACRRNLTFALANQNGDPTYSNSAPSGPFGTGFSLTNPYVIDGVFTASYNTPAFFEFPTFYTPPQLPNGGFDAIPNGYWDAYFWVSAPLLYSQVSDARMKNTIRFLASLKNTDGLAVIRTSLVRPVCPNPPIQMGITWTDLSYRGPYILRFTEPRGGLISSANYTCANLPCVTPDGEPVLNCIDIAPEFAFLPTVEARREACDQRMQNPGVSVLLQVGTGPQSPGYDGGYTVSVGTEGGLCGSEYVEFMTALLSLQFNIECRRTTCTGRSDGAVDANAIGGTRIPFLEQEEVQGSHMDTWIPLYHYNWTTPLGLLHTPALLRVPEGYYSGRLCDYNGCCVDSIPATCYVNSTSAGLRLIPTASFPGNCSGDPSTLEFTVEGDYPPFSLYRVTNKTVFIASGYTILADRNAIPGEVVTYIVVNSQGCTSPAVSFQSEGPINFQLTANVVFFPCDVQTATGRIMAMISPPNLGTVLEWVNVNTGQVVFNNANSGDYPFLDDAPAGTYRVTATSTLYGCQKSVVVDLAARAPPQITVLRSPVSASRDIVSGFIVSDNGPTYVIEFIGMPENVTAENQFVLNTDLVFDTTMRYSITNLIATVTFIMKVTDAGGCFNSVTSLGRTITEIDVLQSPTPLPNVEYNQSEIIRQLRESENHPDHRLMVTIMSIFAGGVLIMVIVWRFAKYYEKRRRVYEQVNE